ncbi:MAG: DMT family transporter [Pseudomonadota bacterium]
MPQRSSTLDLGLWLALAVMWSSSYAVIKVGVETVAPMVLVAGRMTIGAVAILAVLWTLGRRLSWSRRAWIDYAVTGLLGSTFPFLLITYGEMSVDSALAAILMGCAPVATIVLANAILPEEPMTERVLIGAGCALAGVALLVGPEALYGLGADVLAQLAIVGATLCYAASTIYIKVAVRRPALEMAAGSMTFGAVFVTIAALVAGQSFAVPTTPTAAGAIIYLGLVSTASANLIYFHLVPRLGATKMSQVNFAVPVGGTLIGAILLGESLDLQRGIALAVILGAVYLVLSSKRVAERQARAV